jgi:hypothetical protein
MQIRISELGREDAKSIVAVLLLLKTCAVVDPYSGFPEWAGDVQNLDKALGSAKEALVEHIQSSQNRSWAAWLLGKGDAVENIGVLSMDLPRQKIGKVDNTTSIKVTAIDLLGV